MIDTTIKMLVPVDKRSEVLQTITALLDVIRSEKGCISCNCSADVEDENILIFKQVWSEKEDLVAHLKSDHFSVLLGAMKLLSIDPEISFNTFASTTGAEEITKARKR